MCWLRVQGLTSVETAIPRELLFFCSLLRIRAKRSTPYAKIVQASLWNLYRSTTSSWRWETRNIRKIIGKSGASQNSRSAGPAGKTPTNSLKTHNLRHCSAFVSSRIGINSDRLHRLPYWRSSSSPRERRLFGPPGRFVAASDPWNLLASDSVDSPWGQQTPACLRSALFVRTSAVCRPPRNRH